MHNNSQAIELQVYLKNNSKKIIKLFQKVANPSQRLYGNHQKIDVQSSIFLPKVFEYFESWEETTIEKTVFSDVLILKTTKKEIKKHILPSFIEKLEYDPCFTEALNIWGKREKSVTVEVLPNMPPMGEVMSIRYHLECMVEAIKGKTLLASIDNTLSESPAVTVFTNCSSPKPSEIFLRKKTAKYQNDFVNIYLWDPEVKKTLRTSNIETSGRFAPDIFVTDIEKFSADLGEINRKRKDSGKATLGFLNYLLYQNAYLFKRSKVINPVFPDIPALWNANRGLGEIDLELFKEEVRNR